MKKLYVYLLAVTFFIVSVVPVFSADNKVDAKALFEQKCSACHNLDRARSKKKTATEWENTVMRMKLANGCPVTDEEAKVIIDYLSKNYGK